MSERYYITGPEAQFRPEVSIVKRELGKLGIYLEGFGITITGVYINPRPYGFDFDCARPRELLALVRSKATLPEDNRDTLEGKLSAAVTHGSGFRQIGLGPRLHLEIGIEDGKCNVHIDSHGYRTAPGEVDLNAMIGHGHWDLAPDKLPWIYGGIGQDGKYGPMIRPMRGLDDRVHVIFGVEGYF